MAKKKPSKHTRGHLSTVDLIPQDLKERLTEALREKRLTQTQIVETFNSLLKERGVKPLSYSAVNRYSKQVAEKTALMEEVNEAARALGENINNFNQTNVGRVLIQVLQASALDVTLKNELSIEEMTAIGLHVQRLEQAAKNSIERERETRKILLEEQKQKLEEAVNKGLISNEVFEQTQHILGIYNEK